MKLITRHPWNLYDAQARFNDMPTKECVIQGQRLVPLGQYVLILPAGIYDVERVKNPFAPAGLEYLVLKGTLIGATEQSFRVFQNERFYQYHVEVIYDFGEEPPPAEDARLRELASL